MIEDLLSGVAIPHHSAHTFFSLMFLCLLRLLPIMTQAPFLGSNVLPFPARVCFGICFFFILFPFLWTSTVPVTMGFNLAFILYGAKEFLIGFVLGFFVSIPFQVAQTAGAFIDFQRGSTSLAAHDPVLQSQTSPIGVLYNYILIWIFFGLNGFQLFIDALLLSYEIMPITSFPSVAFLTNSRGAFWQESFMMLHKVTLLFTQLSAPAVVAIFLGDMFLGVANRLAPQVQISFLGAALKSLLGIAFIYLSWDLFIKQMGKELVKWFATIDGLLRTVS